MEKSEYNEVLALIADEVSAIVHAQRVLAGIKEELEKNITNPHEQDYIYQDQFGHFPSEEIIREIDGVKIITRILHQTGKRLKDIHGADLLYEIEGEKYALIQYKKPRPSDGRVTADKEQLEDLISACPSVCFYKRNRPAKSPVRLNGFCGCWYAVRGSSSNSYMHACEAQHIFGGKVSAQENLFRSGLTKDEFERLFASCRIGAITSIKRSKFYITAAVKQGHMVFHVTQQGRWKKRRHRKKS